MEMCHVCLLLESNKTCTCCKCKLIALLEEKVTGLEVNQSTLQFIREDEEFLDMEVHMEEH